MTKTVGLSDNQRTLIGIVFSALLATNVSLAGLAASSEFTVPSGVYFALGLAAVIIYAVKDQLGVRDSTTSAVSREVNKALNQFRKPADTQLPPTPPSVA